MHNLLRQFATTAEAGGQDSSIFGALGIDWRMLVLQIVAFVVLVWFLGKFVYPILTRAVDKRESAIADSVAAAHQAEEMAEKSQAEITALLAQAKTEASDIVDMAHKEAQQQIKDAEDKAKNRADQIVSDARQQLDRDVIKARAELKSDTAELVALATEKIVRSKVDDKKDKALIEAAIKEAA